MLQSHPLCITLCRPHIRQGIEKDCSFSLVASGASDSTPGHQSGPSLPSGSLARQLVDDGFAREHQVVLHRRRVRVDLHPPRRLEREALFLLATTRQSPRRSALVLTAGQRTGQLRTHLDVLGDGELHPVLEVGLAREGEVLVLRAGVRRGLARGEEDVAVLAAERRGDGAGQASWSNEGASSGKVSTSSPPFSLALRGRHARRTQSRTQGSAAHSRCARPPAS